MKPPANGGTLFWPEELSPHADDRAIRPRRQAVIAAAGHGHSFPCPDWHRELPRGVELSRYAASAFRRQ